MKKIAIWILILSAPLWARNNLVSLNLNQTDLELALEQSRPLKGATYSFVGTEFLAGEDEFEKGHYKISGYIKAMGLTPIPGLGILVGFKASATRVEMNRRSENIVSLPVQAGVSYTLPIILRTHLQASIGYAPKMLIIGKADSYQERRARLVLEPIDGGLIYLGWRSLEYDQPNRNQDYQFNESVYVGIGMAF